MVRLFCLHLIWEPSTFDKAKLHSSIEQSWTCKQCGKTIVRRLHNPPINYIG